MVVAAHSIGYHKLYCISATLVLQHVDTHRDSDPGAVLPCYLGCRVGLLHKLHRHCPVFMLLPAWHLLALALLPRLVVRKVTVMHRLCCAVALCCLAGHAFH
jgi:hypothetical protein